ncbi:MAG: hypothetical protein WD491_10655 [Balneolales bacterium]
MDTCFYFPTKQALLKLVTTPTARRASVGVGTELVRAGAMKISGLFPGKTRNEKRETRNQKPDDQLTNHLPFFLNSLTPI